MVCFFLLSSSAAAAKLASVGSAQSAAAVRWWWAPLLTASLAVVGGWIAVSFDRRKATNQELIKKRIEVYETLVPKANDLLCYFTCRGSWKTLTPDRVIAHKREMDRLAYVYGPLFSRHTIRAYHSFIHTCFKTFVGSGMAAHIRADVRYLKGEWKDSWRPEWDRLFVPAAEAVDLKLLRSAYGSLLEALAQEIGASRSKFIGLQL